MSIHVMSWVQRNSPDLTGSTYLVLLAHADQADDSGWHFAGLDYVADWAHVSRSTAQRANAELIAAGYLAVKRSRGGRGHSSEYVVLMGTDGDDVAVSRGWPGPNNSDEPERKTPVKPSQLDLVSGEESKTAAAHETWSETRSDCDGLSTETWSKPGQNLVTVDLTVPNTQYPTPKELASRARENQLSPTLRELASAITHRGGSAVRWDLDPHDQRFVEAQLTTVGIPAMAAYASAEADRKGWPVSARAWVPGWLTLAPPQRAPSRSPWCGACHETTRMRETDTDAPTHCPTCHPKFTSAGRF